jgi:Na+:H+ antiporter, NhaA family
MPTPEPATPSRAEPASERRALASFLHDEAVGGAVLALATVVALVWANVAGSSYHDLWSTTVGPSSPLHLDLDLHAWVNDGLMTIFFFAVGLEIKRELAVGELSSPRDAAMPVIAAIGGMVVPALLYLAWTTGTDATDGWGIPVATDIAFVLGVLSLLGRRAPTGLRLFLLALAIVDDIGGIIVIAAYYSSGVDTAWLAVAALAIVAVVAMRRIGVLRPLAYVPAGVVLWVAMHESGVHATIAGVVLGLLTPAGLLGGREVLADLEHRLHPWSAFVIVPLFALANAGVVLSGDALRDAAASRVTWGIVFGLVAGKLLGITAATLAARRLGIGRLPDGVTTFHLVAGAALAGVGFTVSLFITEIAFAGTTTVPAAKIGVLAASITAAILATALFIAADRRKGT